MKPIQSLERRFERLNGGNDLNLLIMDGFHLLETDGILSDAAKFKSKTQT